VRFASFSCSFLDLAHQIHHRHLKDSEMTKSYTGKVSILDLSDWFSMQWKW
jgi:hypothetical protein